MLRKLRDKIKHYEVGLFCLAVVLGVYLAGATLLKGAKYPHEATWAPWKIWFVLMLVAAVFVPLYAFYKALDAYFLGEDKNVTKLKSDLDLLCQRTVAAIVAGCAGVSANELCAQVWLCKKDGTFDRRSSFFLPDVRKRSGIAWGKGKGVAGTAWTLDEDLLVDLGDLRRELAKGAAEFERLDPSVRYGLTAAEAKNSSGYAGVCALRLVSHSASPRLLGIFIIDYSGDGRFDCVADRVETFPVDTYVASCEQVLTDAEAMLPV